MSPAEKKRIMGAARSQGESQDKDRDVAAEAVLPINEEGAQPINYEQMIPEVYSELIHRVNAKVVYDCTASDSVLPHVCLQEGVPYMGLCYSAAHKKLLEERLAFLVFNDFVDEGSSLYKPKLAQIMKEAGAWNLN